MSYTSLFGEFLRYKCASESKDVPTSWFNFSESAIHFALLYPSSMGGSFLRQICSIEIDTTITNSHICSVRMDAIVPNRHIRSSNRHINLVENGLSLNRHIHLVGMTATVPNRLAYYFHCWSKEFSLILIIFSSYFRPTFDLNTLLIRKRNWTCEYTTSSLLKGEHISIIFRIFWAADPA